MFKYANNTSCDLLPSDSIVVERAMDEDLLVIECDMIFSGENVTGIRCSEPYSIPVSPLADLTALSKDLSALFEESVYADVSLKVGEDILRVHKVILCARSSVFAKMFETPMGEKAKNVVDITDLELPVLQDLVSYLYTGVLAKDDFESVYALYYAADKYDVPSLLKTCSDVLLSKMDVENASRVLALADQHSDFEFKDSVVNFIKLSFDDVLATDAWEELVKNAPKLATEVISAWSKQRTNKVHGDKNA